MDAHRFDALVRQLAHRLPRRHVMRIAGAVVLSQHVVDGSREVEARTCHIVGERCGKGIKGRCCQGATCRRQKAGRGRCACPAGFTNCNGYCFDIMSDPLGCGPTCRTCPLDTDCCSGSCCPEGQRCCGGACTDLTTDNENCGGCTQLCPEGMTCCGSRCRLLESDPRHCGKCGHTCGRGYVCQQGQCVCPAGWQDCGDGVCRNLQVDNDHCGQCTNACSRLNRCEQGQCVCGRDGVICVGPQNPNTVCGVTAYGRCTENYECCSGSCNRDNRDDPEGVCGSCLRGYCDDSSDCCGGLSCETRPRDGLKFCGGCAATGGDCLFDSECCVSSCTVDEVVDGVTYKTCASLAGGPCRENFDCRSCYRGRRCVNACVGGRCQY